MTVNMKEFIKENNKSTVVMGEHLTDELKPFKKLGDVTTCTRYILKNGKVFIINKEDKESAPYYVPDWGF